ncbi:hypothetical protein F4781DRAFT_411141 [Annulohypoxylon bovei var. microspora]|nr:hypothetical protein F4781DRAFT_411141 [Annulohypoxylon bovei var. microspora]
MDDNDTTTIVGVIVAVLAVLSVALRFYARYYTKAGFGWDDWLILLAVIAIIVTDILVLWANSVNPNGAYVASNTDPNYEYTPADVLFNKIDYIGTVLYYTITSTTKLSILLMYRRLFSVNTLFRHQVHVVSILVTGFWIGCTVADLLDCIPIEWTWNNALADPRYCFNYNIFWLASGVVEAFIDVLIIAMPIRLAIGLQMTRSKKIAVAAIFLLGLFVILSGLVKVILSYAPGSREPSFGRTEVWTTVHCCTGIVCACLPICWPIFTRLARLSPGTWPAVSSIRKRWYSISGGDSMNRSAPRSSTLELERNADLDARDYELPTYNFGDRSYIVPVEGTYGELHTYYEHHHASYVAETGDQLSNEARFP